MRRFLSRSGIAAAFGLGAAQAMLRLVFGFFSIKVTAVVLGPSGLTLVAQLNNFISLCQAVLANGAGAAVVRLASEHADEGERRQAVLRTAWKMVAVLGGVAALSIVVLSPWISSALLAGEHHPWAIALAGLAVWALACNTIIIGTLNAAQRMAHVATANMLATIGGFVIFVPACWRWGLEGGLVGSALAYFATLASSALMFQRSSAVHWREFRGVFSRPEAKRILDFYPMLLAHSAMAPLTLLLLRDVMSRSLGLEATGHWQAVWRLSEVYLSVITTSMGLYFMPKLGQVIRNPVALRREVLRTFTIVVALTSAIAATIFVCRELIVHWVFAPSFAPMLKLMPFQLLGDVVKTAAWTLGYVLVALVRRRWYVGVEVVSPLLFAGAAALLVPKAGALGVTWAYVLSAAVQLVLVGMALRDVVWPRRPNEREVSA
jgi:O-antigen/teichoic acid export membrane protein